MKKLYEINSELEFLDIEIRSCVDHATGEITDQDSLDHIESLKESLTMDKKTKSLNIAKMIKNYDAESVMLDNEIKNLKARLKSSQNSVEYWSNYLTFSLRPVESEVGQTYSDSQVSIKWRKSESVNIVDQSLLDPEFIVVKTIETPDKGLIKSILKEGVVDVLGAELKTKYNLGIK